MSHFFTLQPVIPKVKWHNVVEIRLLFKFMQKKNDSQPDNEKHPNPIYHAIKFHHSDT